MKSLLRQHDQQIKSDPSLTKMPSPVAINEDPVHDVPPIVHEVLQSPGQALDEQTRAFFEVRFRQDFSQVRVHTDARSVESAEAVNALAYTVGRDVVFGAGHYSPSTIEGKQLLGHELIHVANDARSGQLMRQQKTPTARDSGESEENLSLLGEIEAILQKVEGSREKYAWALDIWLRNNFTHFLKRTARNPALSWNEAAAKHIVFDSLDSATHGHLGEFMQHAGVHAGAAAASKGLEFLAEAGLARAERWVGTAAAESGAAVVVEAMGEALTSGVIILGFCVEVLLTWLLSAAEKSKEIDEAKAEVEQNLGNLILFCGREAHGKANRLVDEVGQEIHRIRQTSLESKGSRTWLKIYRQSALSLDKLVSEAPSDEDTSLADAMLKRWVLEHAAGIDKPSRATPSTWKDVSTEQFGGSITAHPDLFLYQTRAHWYGDLSIDCHGKLDAVEKEIQEYVKNDSTNRTLLVNPKDLAATAVNMLVAEGTILRLMWDLEKREFKFEPSDIVDPYVINRLRGIKSLLLSDQQSECLRNKQFYLIGKWKLDTRAGSIFVDRWDYEIHLTGKLGTLDRAVLRCSDNP